MFGTNELAAMYRTNFLLLYNFKWSLDEMARMLPFEREIYISMLNNELMKEQNQQT